MRQSKGIKPGRIRLCVVVASPDIIGGHSVQATRLMRGLSAEPGMDVEFLWINPRLPGLFRHAQRVKYLRTLATLLLYVIALLVRLKSVDVVHVFSASYWSFLLGPAPAVLIARFYQKPVLLNYHSGEARDHLARWRRVALPIMRLASVIVVPSRFLVDVFAELNLDVIAIPNTVDPGLFKFRRREPLGATLLCNRNLEPNYNVGCVLRAFALVQREVPASRLIVAGDGSEANKLARLAARLRLRNVDFVGSVDPLKMPEVYDSADIFVNSSVVDCMPLSILEAFACGLPVVTTWAGGIPYIVRHSENGWMVEPRNHHALAQGILSLLRDPDLAGRLAEAGLSASNQYTWEAARPHWLAVYKRLVHAECVSAGSADVAILHSSQEAE